MKVLIGTKNPGKIKGAKMALENYFENVEVVGISSPSGVSEQPIGEETFVGAKNRVENLVKYALENNISADMFVAVESGIFSDLGFCYKCCCHSRQKRKSRRWNKRKFSNSKQVS